MLLRGPKYFFPGQVFVRHHGIVSDLSRARCHGLMDRVLGSGDRVRGFKSRSWRSVFSGLFQAHFFSFFFPLLANSLPHNACWPMNSGFTILYGGGKKRPRKIQVVPSVEAKHRSKYDVWEKGVFILCTGQCKSGIFRFLFILTLASSDLCHWATAPSKIALVTATGGNLYLKSH